MKALSVRKVEGHRNVARVSMPLDQKGYEVGVFTGRRSYLWMGPTDGDGTVLTLDVSEMKRLLRKAGQLAR